MAGAIANGCLKRLKTRVRKLTGNYPCKDGFGRFRAPASASGLSAGDIAEGATAVESDEARRAGAAAQRQQQRDGSDSGGKTHHAYSFVPVCKPASVMARQAFARCRGKGRAPGGTPSCHFLSTPVLPVRQARLPDGKETLLSISMIRRQDREVAEWGDEKEKSGLSALQCDNYRFFRVAVFIPHLLGTRRSGQPGKLIT
ncbi:hypothetical protein FB597_101322 [Herbaspirillum sp. SJZ099]|nr:hypothetical protein FB597_101322 [Herbaspirillum sp. SJZ099]